MINRSHSNEGRPPVHIDPQGTFDEYRPLLEKGEIATVYKDYIYFFQEDAIESLESYFSEKATSEQDLVKSAVDIGFTCEKKADGIFCNYGGRFSQNLYLNILGIIHFKIAKTIPPKIISISLWINEKKFKLNVVEEIDERFLPEGAL